MLIKEDFDFLIQWHLTERCNLRCRHCYQTGEEINEMTLSEIKETLNEIKDTFAGWREAYEINISTSFNITGGEPFLRRDFFHIIDYMRSLGFDIYVLTNGTLINKDAARNLYDTGVKGVQVSIEGQEEAHDYIRGKGSFSASMRGTSYLLEAGLQVTFNITLSSINADSLTNMIDLARSVGVRRLGFSRLVPSGRGLCMINEMLNPERIKRIYEHIFSINSGDIEIVTGDPLASQLGSLISVDGGDIPLGGCAAGVSGLTILSDGTMTPCRRLPIPVGNIREDSFRNVWATSRVLELLRDRSKYKGKCGNCNRWAVCRGCRAIAYAYSKVQGQDDFLAEDPQCFLNEPN